MSIIPCLQHASLMMTSAEAVAALHHAKCTLHRAKIQKCRPRSMWPQTQWRTTLCIFLQYEKLHRKKNSCRLIDRAILARYRIEAVFLATGSKTKCPLGKSEELRYKKTQTKNVSDYLIKVEIMPS